MQKKNIFLPAEFAFCNKLSLLVSPLLMEVDVDSKILNIRFDEELKSGTRCFSTLGETIVGFNMRQYADAPPYVVRPE